MKKIALALAVAALAGGCAQSERMGTGGPHHDFTIHCPAGELQICFAEARRLCPRGYDVLSMRRPEPGPFNMIIRDQVVVRCET
jgi:hypothetical protein